MMNVEKVFALISIFLGVAFAVIVVLNEISPLDPNLWRFVDWLIVVALLLLGIFSLRK